MAAALAAAGPLVTHIAFSVQAGFLPLDLVLICCGFCSRCHGRLRLACQLMDMAAGAFLVHRIHHFLTGEARFFVLSWHPRLLCCVLRCCLFTSQVACQLCVFFGPDFFVFAACTKLPPPFAGFTTIGIVHFARSQFFPLFLHFVFPCTGFSSAKKAQRFLHPILVLGCKKRCIFKVFQK